MQTLPIAWLLRLLRPVLGLALAVTVAGHAAPSDPIDAAAGRCPQQAAAACLQVLTLPGQSGHLRYYSSRTPAGAEASAVHQVLLVMHGYPRDAIRTFETGLQVAQAQGRLDDTLVVAPLFQVGSAQAARCRSAGVPEAEPGEALWRCSGWLSGALSQGADPIDSFAALDALVAALARQWPELQTVTLAGFSGGAQMLQRYIGFAAPAPAGVARRYVIADPGSWLYFDPVRPQPDPAGSSSVDGSACAGDVAVSAACSWRFAVPSAETCPDYDHWKYGVQALPESLRQRRSAAAARQTYQAADISYLEGADDSGTGKRAYYRILDKSCAAMLQGPDRLQRGLAYLAYERAGLASDPARGGPGARSMTVVAGCAHDVRCVFRSASSRAILLPPRAEP